MGIIRVRSTTWVPILFVGLLLNTGAFAQNMGKAGTVVQAGSVVSFDYTLTDDDGKVIDSSKGKQPMSYTQGKGEIIPGLEKELNGLTVGAVKKVQVKPEEAYGPIDPKAVQEIPKEKLPPEALKVGTVLMAQGPQGQGVPVRVQEIKENTVIMDFNHPLAGKTLSFDVKITDIKPGK